MVMLSEVPEADVDQPPQCPSPSASPTQCILSIPYVSTRL